MKLQDLKKDPSSAFNEFVQQLAEMPWAVARSRVRELLKHDVLSRIVRNNLQELAESGNQPFHSEANSALVFGDPRGCQMVISTTRSGFGSQVVSGEAANSSTICSYGYPGMLCCIGQTELHVNVYEKDPRDPSLVFMSKKIALAHGESYEWEPGRHAVQISSVGEQTLEPVAVVVACFAESIGDNVVYCTRSFREKSKVSNQMNESRAMILLSSLGAIETLEDERTNELLAQVATSKVRDYIRWHAVRILADRDRAHLVDALHQMACDASDPLTAKAQKSLRRVRTQIEAFYN